MLDPGSLETMRMRDVDAGVVLLETLRTHNSARRMLSEGMLNHLAAKLGKDGKADSAGNDTATTEARAGTTNGHPLFTLSPVALNDTIMVFAFAPIVASAGAVVDHRAVGHADRVGHALHRDPGVDRAPGLVQPDAGLLAQPQAR